MKILTVSALVCALMALTTADAVQEAKATKDQTDQRQLVKRPIYCPSGWSRFRGRCFRYMPRAMNWADAEKKCQSMNANLASVHNIEEYHEIQRLILTATNVYKKAWIGGSDAQKEGDWQWSDGSRFIDLNWCSGQPDNNFFGQDCLQMNHGGESKHIISSESVKLQLLCQKYNRRATCVSISSAGKQTQVVLIKKSVNNNCKCNLILC
ncbi:galactose-specific lectin nattectin-like isoform X1 [Thunnus maccoyii]|uniref:galactose-specific lectin nattectin-like isoform X1 n=1 Tax=Thunnus maccoyii TaxID=8240 RepID=UPI001C4AF698|nr:galactose-specific lectin nattectin-like isoform X1 [Thunnus maccoyii]XP_042256839.1 galactose-specific lectin nattectin-like isoform X1 [Thunnus maccoyii]XP_042256840.1 galactose-specific lectin nattectin-like isoform X1 [Thunnus maccoyii]